MTSYDKDKEDLLARLRRIEGQTRGLQKMIEEEKYCIDIITQVSSIQAALDKVSLILIENHMKGCMVEAVQQGKGDEKITEVMSVLRRYTKA